MVHFSTKTLLFSAALLALNLDGIYAADTCQAVDTPCGGSRLKCCDGLECLGYSYMDMPDGVCRPVKSEEEPAPPPPEDETPPSEPPADNEGQKKCLLGIKLLCF
ncbi:hypothetical protein BJV82DRAFT_72549 [Fennellomyces sp. T-0311]|nr:hypothetical protein BJV82DRAFT_72549 [Fennellomyces sp. T-0311]